MSFSVYILYSNKLDRYYVGFTSLPIEQRIRRHLSNHKGYTGLTKDWNLFYIEVYETKEQAMKREKEIKSWKDKKRIEELIVHRE
jgi:putative endonuclease